MNGNDERRANGSLAYSMGKDRLPTSIFQGRAVKLRGS